jgi:hypothetical protein
VHDSYGPYDAIQANIVGNHIAIVDKARGGENVKINDSWADFEKSKFEPKKGDEMPVKKKINGITVEFSDQGADAVDGLLKALDDSEKKNGEMEVVLKDQKAAFDKLQGEHDALKTSQLTDADIEKQVNERMSIVDKARALKDDLDPAGKKLIDIRVEAIQHVDSDFELKDKSDAYVEGVFDSLYAKREKKGTKSAREAGKNAGSGNEDEVSIADTAREKYIENGQYAWMDTLGIPRPGKEA